MLRWRELKEKKGNLKAPGGILLHGLPGTGKTLLATACAGEFGLPFLATTGTRLLDPKFQDRIFALLKKHAPAMLFVDEIDAVCADGVALRALQGHMDGFASGDSAPVYVIAATNYEQLLPPALKRPGRLDKAVWVPLPDLDARRKLFEPVSERLTEPVLKRLLDFTAGLSGAELGVAVRDMALHKNEDGASELDEATARKLLLDRLYGERLTVTDEDRKRVAYHEAGHAALLLDNAERGLEKNYELRYMTLSLRERDAAHVSSELRENVFSTRNKETVLREMAVDLAGMTAQGILAELGKPGADDDPFTVARNMKREVDSGAGSDLTQANRLAHIAVTTGLDEKIGLHRASEKVQAEDRGGEDYGPPRDLVDDRMRVWLWNAEQMARNTLAERWPLVKALAEKLLEKEALGRAEIDDIYAEWKKNHLDADGTD